MDDSTDVSGFDAGADLMRGAQRDDVVVVLPTYNEAGNVRAMAAAVTGLGMRLLIVDDDSPDGTGDIADELALGERIDVLHRAEKAGLGPAYAAGFAKALSRGAEIICEMDADFSHDPTDLPRLIHAVDGGADLAIGSRYVAGGGVENWPLRRRILSRGGNLYANVMLGVRIGDMTSGFRAFRAGSLRRLHAEDCRSSGYAFQIEMAWRAHRLGMTIEEIPILFRDRAAGDSKMSTSIALEAVALVSKWGLGRLFGRVPLPAREPD